MAERSGNRLKMEQSMLAQRIVTAAFAMVSIHLVCTASVFIELQSNSSVILLSFLLNCPGRAEFSGAMLDDNKVS